MRWSGLPFELEFARKKLSKVSSAPEVYTGNSNLQKTRIAGASLIISC